VGVTARECVMCGCRLGLHKEGAGASLIALLPDFLLFLLVACIAAVGWWWRPWETRSYATPELPTARALAPPTPTATPSPSATFHPTATATSVPTLAPTPSATRTPTETPAATSSPSATSTMTKAPEPTHPPPTSAPSPTTTHTGTSTTTPSPSPAATATSAPVRTHVVAQGDTPGEIAARYGIETAALMQANPGLNPRRLQIGEELLIPAPGTAAEVDESSEAAKVSRVVTHTVQLGETLLRIGGQYGVTLNDLYALNPGVSPQFLRPGQILRIVLGPPTPTATSTPSPTATALPYPAPVLLGPLEGEEFRGANAHILLWWTSVGILDGDEWYVLRLLYEERMMEDWTKVPSWRVPFELFPSPGGSPLLHWQVVVRRADGTPEGKDISPVSSYRSFVWR
jgi:LysM repeat protein